MKEELRQYLLDHPLAREQRYISQATWGFLSRKYKFETLNQDLFYKIGTKFDSVRRIIAMLQEEDESLRGKDWQDRRVREQKKQIELGYAPGFYQDIKLAEKIC